MLTFSTDPVIAERQMKAIIFYLTTFGYIDGDFDASEKEFVRDYIRKLVARRVESGMPDAEASVKEEVREKFTAHFHEIFEGIDTQVKELFTEAVAKDEDQDQFVHAKLKLRCFEIFESFDRQNQEQLMETVDELIHADGQVHPAEVKFRAELADLLESELGIELVDEGGRPSINFSFGEKPKPKVEKHPFFDQLEFHYSKDPETIAKQMAADRELIQKAIDVWAEQREKGTGKLTGKKTVEELAEEAPFLDGHVYVHPPSPDETYELVVLGDLHGCYSNLKAAILQSHFFQKVEAYRKDSRKNPKPLLVLLGDYIDRGLFSLNGVLRTVLQILSAAPEHVYVLRGNHEYYLEYKGQIYGGVKPAEAINSLKPHVPIEVFRHYIKLFEAMPNMLLFGQMMFVHGGIPRDLLIKERVQDLAGLNDEDVRFQMMWSDPSTADVIPAQLQEQSARFPFGKLQAAAFLGRMGLHTLVRGHEKVNEGFKRHYEGESAEVLTVFSAGGATNDDLPEDSSYRSVTPHALTVTWKDGEAHVQPWEIDYERFNDPEKNAFFAAPMEIEHRTD